MADECNDEAQLERMCTRLDELQKARFGQYRSALQGDPAPKSADQRYYDKLQREIEEALGAVDMDFSAKDVRTAIAGIEAYDRRAAEARRENIALQNPSPPEAA